MFASSETGNHSRGVRRQLLPVGLGLLCTTWLALGTHSALAQYPAPAIPQNTAKHVSPHVWVIMTFPNIAIVTGTRATLVVDTGLGARNGSIVAAEAKKLSHAPLFYLTTTHYHPEHAGGDQGFPVGTVIIRNSVQQEEVNELGSQMYDRFRSLPQFGPFLDVGHTFRPADIVFDREATVDLGGVAARLFWLGAAHTNGDELISVPGDSTLITGDVVQNKLVPHMTGTESSAKSWISVLDHLALLKPAHIIPDHGELGDGSLIALQRSFLVDAETGTLAAKREGKSADQAAKSVGDALKAKYSDWGNANYIDDTVKEIYARD